MSCKALKLKGCEVAGSTFSGRKFTFSDRQINRDIFTATVFNISGIKVATLSGVKADDTVYFSFVDLEKLQYGSYSIRYWANLNDVGLEMIAIEDFKISREPCNCEESNDVNYTLEFKEETVSYSMSVAIVNNIKSAYDIAVENGFVGTEAEWLVSLKGADGVNGKDGAKGDPGPAGPQGIQGLKGDTGATGAKGDKGDTGATGLQGIQGIQGAKGDKGDPGTTSWNGITDKPSFFPSDNLILSYTHTGNKETYIQSYDEITGTYTTNGPHGLSNNTIIVPTWRNNIELPTGQPKLSLYTPVNLINTSYGTFVVVNQTTNTFQIANTAGGSPLILSSQASMDFSLWMFESGMPDNLNFTGLDVNDCNIHIGLKRGANIGTFKVLLNSINYRVLNNWNNNPGFTSGIVIRTLKVSYGYIIINNIIGGVNTYSKVDQSLILENGQSVNNTSEFNLIPQKIDKINSIQFFYLFPLNGCQIKIYKK